MHLVLSYNLPVFIKLKIHSFRFFQQTFSNFHQFSTNYFLFFCEQAHLLGFLKFFLFNQLTQFFILSYSFPVFLKIFVFSNFIKNSRVHLFIQFVIFSALFFYLFFQYKICNNMFDNKTRSMDSIFLALKFFSDWF